MLRSEAPMKTASDALPPAMLKTINPHPSTKRPTTALMERPTTAASTVSAANEASITDAVASGDCESTTVVAGMPSPSRVSIGDANPIKVAASSPPARTTPRANARSPDTRGSAGTSEALECVLTLQVYRIPLRRAIHPRPQGRTRRTTAVFSHRARRAPERES
ncbi:MAG: hypothetical protein EBR10_05445 [Planctomycetes bacterium]|nr:hypothetical protein [Planctomycetota bacterium]